MKKIVSFLFICLFFTACGKNFTTIDANKAVELMESENVVVIDVRDKEEYNSGHIANAINIPLDDITSINYDKETIIILYCNTSIRSAEAAEELVNLGYSNIYNLDGGLLNWGFELEEE